MEEEVRQLIERTTITDIITKLFVSTDRRDWLAVQDCFGGKVLFDMTSLTGGEPTMATPQQITEGWDKGLKPLHAIHHQAGNYQVTVRGDTADVHCYAVAWHYLPNPSNRNTRSFIGSYDFHLTHQLPGGWKIDAMKFNLKFMDGNKELEAAQARL